MTPVSSTNKTDRHDIIEMLLKMALSTITQPNPAIWYMSYWVIIRLFKYIHITTGRWFSPVSATNKTNRHDLTEMMLKKALNTINQSIFIEDLDGNKQVDI